MTKPQRSATLILFIIAGVGPVGGWDLVMTAWVLNASSGLAVAPSFRWILGREVALETNLANR
jgi:hypothetical protein